MPRTIWMDHDPREPPAPSRRWRAKPIVVDGIRFASQAEARRYGELQLLVQAGEIGGLLVQPRFRFDVNGVLVGTYIADFAYLVDGVEEIVEDVKSPMSRTPIYRIKAKLMQACYAITVREIDA